MQNPKLAVSHAYKIFGNDPAGALDLLRQSHDKQEILARTGATVGVQDASFEVRTGEIFVVMGLSGSGKSTLVRMLNGLIPPTAGQILVDGEDIATAGPAALRRIRRKKVAMVFQHFALFPHWTVAENVAYGLKITGTPRHRRHARALEVLDQVGLAPWADSRPSDLSGGMQQRVGIARGLAADPDILLMDEPFGALDPLIRREMQMELLNLQQKLQKTIVFITHDLNEALLLGSRIAIMKDGRIVQTGTAQEIVTAPADDYVAAFVADIDRGRVFTADDVSCSPTTIQLRETSVRDALRMMERGSSHALYVMDGDRVAGVVTYQDLAASEMDPRPTTTLQDALITDYPTADSTTSLSDLYGAAGSGLPIAVTDDRERLLAVVQPSDVLAHLSGDATPESAVPDIPMPTPAGKEQADAQPR